jgi:hypothetical protein
MGHVILLGDSIFDNAAYVRGGPDVVKQLRAKLPSGWSASLLAVDGAVTRSVASQLARVPANATRLVVSVGGNDALGASHILGQAVRSVAEAVAVLGAAQRRFAADYASMVESLLALGLPTALCTIYDTPETEEDQPIIRTALSVFNDVITRAAFSNRLPLIDLRLICSEPEDYANPIEPSVQGGDKIAGAIAALAAAGREGGEHSIVIA